MQQQNNTPENNSPADAAPVQKIAENPNPRANENIRHTSFDEKVEQDAGSAVGTEITDGEAG